MPGISMPRATTQTVEKGDPDVVLKADVRQVFLTFLQRPVIHSESTVLSV